MVSRHIVRSVPGRVAFLLAATIATSASVTAVYSFFYEGWGQPASAVAGYLVFPVLVVAACAVAVCRPRAGGLLLLAGGVGAAAWWMWGQATMGRTAANVLQTAVMFFAPVLLAGGCFLLEARHRRLLVAEGVQTSSRWWVRNYQLIVVVAVPILAVAIGPARQLPDMLARYDDGLRGVRTIAGNGVTLVWAPRGPGWNCPGPDGSHPSWNTAATQCAYLSEDGAALLPDAIHAWRLPTADEVIRSLTRRGRNAGCRWDGKSPHAACSQPPDKETPLWAPDQAPIYYLTSDAPDPDGALGVNYTGGITWHRRTAESSGVGYRCVKPVK